MRGHALLKTTVVFSVLLLTRQTVFAVSTFGRSYDFSFEKGSLIRNWSFEQNLDNWSDESWSSTQVVTARKLAKSIPIPAVTGSYVGMFSGTNSTSGTLTAFQSAVFPVEPRTDYTLSLYAYSVSNTANLAPVVQFFSSAALDPISPSFTGLTYFQNTKAWVYYGNTFTTPAGCNYARLVLVQAGASQGGTVYFDDVMLEKGGVPITRDRVGESLTFWDDAGQTQQSQVRIAGGGNNASSRKYLVSGNEYDVHRYPQYSYLPWVNSGVPDFDGAQSSKSVAYNNGTNGMGTEGVYPYTQTVYAEEPGGRLIARIEPASYWQGKPTRSGSAFVDNLNPPTSLESPPIPVSNGQNVEGQYLYQWAIDVEGHYSLSWSDIEGRLIQQASNLSGRWVYTRYEYYPNGNIKKALTPFDDPNDEANQNYRQVTNYNSAGEVTSTYSAEKGLVKYYSNRLGQTRFVQKDQDDPDRYLYTDYDLQDRPVSKGEELFYDFDPAMAEDRSTTGDSKTEHVGYIYDDLTTFQARLGFPYTDILPAGANVGANATGRLVCDFAWNDQVGYLPGDTKRHLVATFYSYDQYGQVIHAYKYIGMAAYGSDQVHHATYSYDEAHRLLSESLYDNTYSSPVLINTKRIGYDNLGRISKITGLNGKFICAYQYFDWGGLKSVTLGGDGSASQGTRIDYTYHAHGWVKEIDAYQQSTGALIFQQELGYEDRADTHDPIPALTQAKFDGSITQQLYKFANDVRDLGAVRLTNYQYDDWGRMITADSRKNANPDAVQDGTQQINYATLSWLDTQDQDSHVQYDDIGRIVQNQSGVSAADAAIYSYASGSYQLDHVVGKLGSNTTRDASPNGNFVYDEQGRMTEDHSKNMVIHYGWNDLPTDFTLGNGDGTQSTEYQFYDASGNRANHIQIKYTQFTNSDNDVRFIGNQEDIDPPNMYGSVDLTEAYGDENLLAAHDMLPPSMTTATFYYIFDKGKTNTQEQGEPDITIWPITRDNGPTITVKVVGVIKGSLAYYDLLKQYFQGTIVSSTTDVGLLGAGDRRIQENWSNGSVSTMQYTAGLLGRGSAVIGRINSAGAYEYFVKNHQGSTMKLVNEDGTFLNDNNTTLDYMSYGDLLKLKDKGDKVQQEFTGKEYADFNGLYSFGARWYDPELGMWLSTDPANEFSNPYSYVGGHVVNLIDPFGLYSWSDFGDDLLTVGGTVGINVLGIGGCVVSSGQVCAVGYYNGRTGDGGVLFGGVGPVTYVGEIHGNTKTMEFQTRGGAGGLLGGAPIGTTWNFGRTRKDGPFFTVDITRSADFSGSHSSNGAPQSDDGDDVNSSITPLNKSHLKFKNKDDEIAYYKAQQGAYDYFIINLSAQVAALAYWSNEGGHGLEAGFLYNDGDIDGPYIGASSGTMGPLFASLIGDGDVVVHIHPYSELKAQLGYGGLSGFNPYTRSRGDMGVASTNHIFAYEVSTGEIYYSNPKLVEKYGEDPGGYANMRLGTWDYHTLSRKAPKFHPY